MHNGNNNIWQNESKNSNLKNVSEAIAVIYTKVAILVADLQQLYNDVQSSTANFVVAHLFLWPTAFRNAAAALLIDFILAFFIVAISFSFFFAFNLQHSLNPEHFC